MTRPLVILMLSLTSAWPLGAMEPPPNLDSALKAQAELVASQPGSPVALNDLGNLLVLAGRYAEAEDAYHAAIALAAEDPAPRFNLALLLQQTGRAQEAEAELVALLAAVPEHAWAHYQLGVLAAAERDRESALDHYARALALEPALSFASNNPHILDNPLFGEALLISQRYRDQPGAGVPRHYGEPERIVDLMLKEKEKATEEKGDSEDTAEEDDAQGAEEDEESGADEPARDRRPEGAAPAVQGSTEALSRRSQGTSTRSAGTPTRSAGTMTRSGGTSTRPTGQPSDPQPSDPQPSGRDGRETPPPPSFTTIGQPGVRPDPGGRAAADQPGRTVVQQPTAGRRLTPVPPAANPPPRSRYIPPSRRSTAQLDLKLLPEEPAEKSG